MTKTYIITVTDRQEGTIEDELDRDVRDCIEEALNEIEITLDQFGPRDV